MDMDRFCKKIKNRKHDFCPKCKTLLDYEEYTDSFKMEGVSKAIDLNLMLVKK